MALVIAVNVSGTPTEMDARAANLIVNQKNVQLAAEDPPGTPLALAPLGALATSYESVLVETLNSAHASYVSQANEAYVSNQERATAFKNATDATQAQIDALLGL